MFPAGIPRAARSGRAKATRRRGAKDGSMPLSIGAVFQPRLEAGQESPACRFLFGCELNTRKIATTGAASQPRLFFLCL